MRRIAHPSFRAFGCISHTGRRFVSTNQTPSRTQAASMATIMTTGMIGHQDPKPFQASQVGMLTLPATPKARSSKYPSRGDVSRGRPSPVSSNWTASRQAATMADPTSAEAMAAAPHPRVCAGALTSGHGLRCGHPRFRQQCVERRSHELDGVTSARDGHPFRTHPIRQQVTDGLEHVTVTA